MKLCIAVVDGIPEIPMDAQIFYEQEICDLENMLTICKKTKKQRGKSLIVTIDEENNNE